MSFETTIRDRIRKTMVSADREKSSKEREILKVVLGEFQQKSASGKATDELGHSIVKTMLKNNVEGVLAVLPADDVRRGDIERENVVLESLLPRYLTAEEIETSLADVTEQIRAAKSEGQATGVAMKALKAAAANVEGDAVRQVVIKIRG